MHVPAETFPALNGVTCIRHAFLCRVPGLDVKTDREIALARLADFHRAAREQLGFGAAQLVTAEQVHGSGVAVVNATTEVPVANVDGLVTNQPNVCLGIYVADCCAIYLVDPKRRAIGLLHSGKKGTELGIVRAAVEKMRIQFGSEAGDMIAQLSPCIRPPDYEVDFAAEIIRQC